MKINVLFASKDPNRAGVLMEAVTRGGYSVTVVQRTREVLGLLSQRGCDLLLVGSHLSDGEGVQLVKTLRSRSQTRTLPVVAVLEPSEAGATADPAGAALAPGLVSSSGTMRVRASHPGDGAGAGRLPTRLMFFQSGADECLTLNQDVAECLARIKAVLRRTLAHPTEDVLRMGPVELNLTSYTLHVSGKQVALTSKELDLLYVFLSSPNRVLSRPYLIERVWGYNYFGSPRTVDVHVRRLREKLGKVASLIDTIPCVGYKLVPPGGDCRR